MFGNQIKFVQLLIFSLMIINVILSLENTTVMSIAHYLKFKAYKILYGVEILQNDEVINVRYCLYLRIFSV